MMPNINAAQLQIKNLASGRKAGNNLGSLSNLLAAGLGRDVSARSIPSLNYDGLRVGAGCLPFMGVWRNRKAAASLVAGESTPTYSHSLGNTWLISNLLGGNHHA